MSGATMSIQPVSPVRECLSISIEALESLDAGLKRLRQFNGHVHPPSDNPDLTKATTPFWFSEPNDYNTNNPIANVDATIVQYQSTVRRYKMALAALSSMSSSLKEHLGEMNYVTKPLVRARGISKIPDEILARIFECIYEPWTTESYYRPKPEDLRLVCKRFQQVADSQPSLRRHFTSKMAIKKIENRLDRCGQVGLRVKLFSHEYEKGAHIITAFADALTPYAHRWEELQFSHVKSVQAVKQAFDKFKALSLPRLERLVLWSQDWDAADSIYSTWTMPNLRRIVFHNGVPLELPGKSDLSECDVVLEGQDIPGFVPELSEFLESSTSLTTLRVTYDGTILTGSYDDYDDETEPIHLPNLRTFHADVRFHSISEYCDDMDKVSDYGQAILYLIEHLNTPKLEQFTVILDNDTYWRRWTSPFLNRWLRVHGKSSSLQTFALTQERHRFSVNVESIVDNPCNGNIVVSGLNLDCREEHPKIRNHQEGAYRLRTLTFKNCRLSIRALKALLQLYTTRELYPNFEGIILEHCDGVTWETLAGVAHSKHVFFRED